MVYLAAPYSHDDHRVEVERFNRINEIAGQLINEGMIIFSPISHSHPIKESNKLPGTWDFWKKYDYEFLKCCDTIIVLMLDGWDTSVGVQSEIKMSKDLGLKVEYMECSFDDTI